MKYGLIGEKLGHSFSKEIHEKLGKYEYELKELAEDELEAFLKSGSFEGINVTIPYKQKVMPYLDEIDEMALKIGAVNTIINKGGRLKGYNTDAGGLKKLIQRLCPNMEGRKVLIAGSGGTSRTAYHVVKELGAAEAFRISRNGRDGAIGYDEAYKNHADAEILINTTPLGMYPNVDGMPFDLDRFKNIEAVADAVYNPLSTALVRAARKRGIAAESGLYMLTSQALLASELFTSEQADDEMYDLIYFTMLLEKQNIVLIGMPGSGKTTIGRILAEKMGREFVDTDEEIVKELNTSISEIFSTRGEEYFRDLESEMVKRVSMSGGKIIACGGGAVLRPENTDALSMNGRIVYLDRDPAELMPTDDRPLADNYEKIMALYEKRVPIYREAADVIVKVDGFDESAAEQIRSVL